jgi:hypothetical protein
MTEDDAKQKWCPYARLVAGAELPMGAKILVDAPAGYNRVVSETTVTTPHAAKCMASACMAWRWASHEHDLIETDERRLLKPVGELSPPFSNIPEGFHVVSHDSGGQYVCRRERVAGHEAATGFCGLAGAPS